MKPPLKPEFKRAAATRLDWLEAFHALDAKRFDFAIRPVEPVPRFFITGKPVSTPGNLPNIIAQAKAGKSAFVGSLIAAAIAADQKIEGADTLGVTATAPGQKILIHFDTEQSVFDHDQLVRRAMSRAGADSMPDWLWSYPLAGFGAEELRNMLTVAMWAASERGGVFAAIVDGTADLVSDVNDAEECNGLVSHLHALAIRYDCPIVNVIHENPGANFGKMRGHLGSQLERKAESNIRMTKADEITIVFADKMRRAPISEKDGPRFTWSDQAGMHVSCETAGEERNDAKRDNLRDQVEAVFIAAGLPSLAWGALREGIEKSEGIGQSGARKRIEAMKKLGVIQKNVIGHWELTPQRPDNAP